MWLCSKQQPAEFHQTNGEARTCVLWMKFQSKGGARGRRKCHMRAPPSAFEPTDIHRDNTRAQIPKPNGITMLGEGGRERSRVLGEG